ncbi:hypothetical protein WG66_000479 [Moniliophthora roreri]|nr:hypothetical protein WG66_000479 [Moniliophthora roreri]
MYIILDRGPVSCTLPMLSFGQANGKLQVVLMTTPVSVSSMCELSVLICSTPSSKSTGLINTITTTTITTRRASYRNQGVQGYQTKATVSWG